MLVMYKKACWCLVWVSSALEQHVYVAISNLFYISLSKIYFNKTNIKIECLENKCAARDMLTKYAINVAAYLESSIYAVQPPQSGHCDLQMRDSAEKTLLES